MPASERCWRLPTAQDTADLAGRFATAWRAVLTAGPRHPDRAWRVALSGELGAGKTTWVRGFVAALGVDAPVASPSYALVQTFEAGQQLILHADFYRLRDAAELDALGLDDFDRAHALWLIEWPERSAGRLGACDLHVSLAIEAGAHSLQAHAGTDEGASWLSQVLD
jgi:tRNA threonylcarbamoyladenosine biosynthesis protein TsaE